MSKRVLLTGASGFIGSHVLEYFLEHTDWTFVCPASWRHKGNPLFIKPNSRVDVVTLDLAAPIPELGHFDYILNLASESHVDRSLAEPEEFALNNVKLMLYVLKYAREHMPEVFLQFSTDEVYGANEHKEWDLLLPRNRYAGSKAAQEVFCIDEYYTSRLPLVITNSNNIIGRNQDVEKFLPKLVKLIGKGETVTIHVSNGRAGVRFYNPVDNVANALLYILTSQRPTVYEVGNPATVLPDRYALPGGTELNNLELAQLVAKAMGRELKYELIDAETVRSGYDEFYPKTDGKLSELGWTAPYSFEDELPRLVAELSA